MRVVTIGSATLYHADCLDALKEIESNSVHFLFSDPPYGNGNHASDYNANLNAHRGIESRPIANDGPQEMRQVVEAVLAEAPRLLTKESAIAMFTAGGGGSAPTFAWLADRMDRDGLDFFHLIIWDKRNPGLGHRYRRQHELVLVGHLTGGKLRWPDKAARSRNVISMSAPHHTKRQHPNEKPLDLCQHFIGLHTAPGDVVLDPFMGCGTAGVAAVQMGRRFIGIELDAAHFEAAVKRLEEAASRATPNT